MRSMYIKWYCRVDFTIPGQFMLVVAFNFKESEINKKTLKEWYCRVNFTSQGEFMLVVAFNFKESESK